MEEDSTPAPNEDGAGGNDEDVNSQGDHSQDNSGNAADKQDDTSKGDGQPSKSTDDSSKGDDAGDDDKGGDAGGDGKKSDDKEPPAPKFDDDLDQWAEKRGYGKLETDKERKIAQDARNNQRAFSKGQEGKKAAETLAKATKDATPKPQGDEDDDADPLEKRVDSLQEDLKSERVMRAQSEYFSANEVTQEEADAMGAFLKEKVERAKAKSPEAAKAALDYWTDPDNLEDWHSMAKAKLGSSGGDDKSTQEIEEEAARKERERIQKEHQASGSSRSASRTTTSDKTEDEKRLERFSNWD